VIGFPIIISCYLDAVFTKKEPFSGKVVAILAALAPMVWLITPHPHGLGSHVSLFVEGGAVLPEWRSLLVMEEYILSLEYLLFFFFMAIFFFAALRTGRKQFPLYSLLGVVVVGSVCFYVRFLPDAVLIGIPVVASWCAGFVPQPVVRERILHMGVIFIFSLTVWGVQTLFGKLDRECGIGVDERRNPLFLGDLMKERQLGGNVYGSFPGTNDFLVFYLFPRVKVPIDIRVPGLYPYEYAEKLWVVRSDDEFQRHVLSLPLDYVIVGCPDAVAPLREHEKGIEESLRRRGWNLIYFDKRYALYRRPGKEDGMRPFMFLSRWNSAAEDVAEAVKSGSFDVVVHDMEMLKKLTKGRDDFYREIFAMVYRLPCLTDEQRETLEKLFRD